jgi:predicted ArsR family transcriptional regulator
MNKIIDCESVLSVFWHRSRRRFVPLTCGDIARRAGISKDQAKGRAGNLVKQGLMRRELVGRPAENVHIFDLTDRGKAAALAMISGGE